MDFKGIFLSAHGRLNRMSYFLLSIMFSIVLSMVNKIIEFIAVVDVLQIILYSILGIINIVISVFLSIKRFHDFGKSAYYMLGYYLVMFVVMIIAGVLVMAGTGSKETGIFVIAIIALVFILYTYLKPGVNGDNQYGSQPLILFDLGLTNTAKQTEQIISNNENNQ